MQVLLADCAGVHCVCVPVSTLPEGSLEHCHIHFLVRYTCDCSTALSRLEDMEED